MQANFFKDVNTANIHGGTFNLNTKPNNTQQTIYHGAVHQVNDRSQHTTNYGGFTNYGSHTTNEGYMTNYGTGSNRLSDYGRYQNDGDGNMRNRSPSPYASSRPNSRFGMRSQPVSYGGLNGGPIPGETVPMPSRSAPPEFRASRPRATSPREDSSDDASFERELHKLSPEMQEYVRSLQQRIRASKRQESPVSDEDLLNEDLAKLNLSDADPERLRPFADRGRSRSPGDQNEPRFDSGSNEPAADFQIEVPEFDEEGNYQFQPRRISVINDNRVITKNVNSNNVHNESTYDSFNDNSTRTEITKEKVARKK